MLLYWIWLSRLQRITGKMKINLLRTFRDPEELYRADEAALRFIDGITQKELQSLADKDLTEARQILKTCNDKNIGILTYSDGAYPFRLKNIEEPPLVLYYKGCLPDWENLPPIAIVGTRKASSYGLQIAAKMGYQIAACGGLVISGGADGIDGKAMEGALAAGKKTVAVLGFGADVVYPAKHRELFERTERQGCLLTEYVPGTPPNSWNFPYRNRIISGLAAGVLVVEAPMRSGALSTARHASEQGRDLFAVPGNADSESCAGSNQLLKERAIPAFSGWDVMQEYEHLYPQSVVRYPGALTSPAAKLPSVSELSAPLPDKKSIDKREKSGYSVNRNAPSDLSEEEKELVKYLNITPIPVDELLARIQLPSGRAMSMLTKLAMKGVVENHPGKRVSLK